LDDEFTGTGAAAVALVTLVSRDTGGTGTSAFATGRFFANIRSLSQIALFANGPRADLPCSF
jgi:hypothetical protein